MTEEDKLFNAIQIHLTPFYLKEWAYFKGLEKLGFRTDDIIATFLIEKFHLSKHSDNVVIGYSKSIFILNGYRYEMNTPQWIANLMLSVKLPLFPTGQDLMMAIDALKF